MKRLPRSSREKQVWDFVLGYLADNDYYPTREEIGLHLGVTKQATTFYVNNLIDKGWLRKSAENKARNIRIAK